MELTKEEEAALKVEGETLEPAYRTLVAAGEATTADGFNRMITSFQC